MQTNKGDRIVKLKYFIPHYYCLPNAFRERL